MNRVPTTPYGARWGRADWGEEGNNLAEDENDDGDCRVRNEEEMEKGVRERLGEPGIHRQCVPEKWENEDGEGDEAGRTLPVVVTVDSHRSRTRLLFNVQRSCHASPSRELDASQ